MKEVLYNQDLIPRNEAVVDIEDRGYQFGDGIYEVVRVYNGKVFMMDEHLERFQRSADELKLTLPYTIEELKSKLAELRSRNYVNEGIIYIQLSRGRASRTHGFPNPPVSPQLIAYTQDMERPHQFQKEGVRGALQEDIRWLRCDIKSLNLLGNVLVKQKAKELNCFEAIQYRGDYVTEGSSTNVFIVKEGILYTHPVTNLILNGITRRLIVEFATALTIQVKQNAFTVQQLFTADEAFITSTTSDIIPLIKVDEKSIGSQIPGPITVQLQERLDQFIIEY